MFNISDLDFVEIDHEKTNKKNRAKLYQKYIDDNQSRFTTITPKHVETIRIVKGFFDDYKIALLTIRKLDKTILTKMIAEIEPNMQIEKIEKQWLRNNINVNINDDNINEGVFEWYVKLSDAYVKLSSIKSTNHIGAGIDKKLLFINIVVDGKLYDKVYLDELNEDIVYAYAKRYQFTLKNHNIVNIENNNIYYE